MYKFLAGIYPKNLKKKYELLIEYSDLKLNPLRLMGFFLSFGFGLAVALSLFLNRLIEVPFIFLILILFFLIELFFYVMLLLKADKKGKFVEGILPDVLQLMSSNLRAGLTTDRALMMSSRPEFGPFKEELNKVGKEIAMGRDLSDSLLDMTESIKSDKLKKTMLLIASGIKSGGELSSLLDQTATNLRQQRFVEEKTRSSIMMYVFFIFVAVGIGSPILFGLSSFLVEVITTNMAAVEMPTTAVTSNLPMSFTKVEISIGFIMTFAVVSLTTSSIVGSLILGLIGKGRGREGVKFIPILMALSLGLFFITRFLVKNVLGGLFGT